MAKIFSKTTSSTRKSPEVVKQDRIIKRDLKNIEGKQVWRTILERYESIDFPKEEKPAWDYIRQYFAGSPMEVGNYPSNEGNIPIYAPLDVSNARTFPIVDMNPTALSEGDLRALVCDETQNIRERVESLHIWILKNHDNAASFIVEQLCKIDLPNEWCNNLVLAAEDLQLKDIDQRSILSARLKEIAIFLRQSEEVGIDTVLWSAIRCYNSLIPNIEITSLLSFLDTSCIIDTRIVALQCIANRFDLSPLTEGDLFGHLSNRINEIAQKFLDPDVFAAGEEAAILEAAIHALAAIGDVRLLNLLKCACMLDKPWLIRQILLDLRRTLEAWKQNGKTTNQAYIQLQEGVNLLMHPLEKS